MTDETLDLAKRLLAARLSAAAKSVTAPATGGAEAQLREKGFSEDVGTFHDGRILKNPQTGESVFVSPGYITKDPALIADMMRGVSPSQTMSDQTALSQAPVAARGAVFLQGVPFLGEYLDEAAGAVFGPKAQEGIRSVQGAMERQNPMTTMALRTAGGVAGSVPMAMAAGPGLIASAPATTGGKVVAGAVLGGGAGAVEGAVSGYGAGNDGSRLKSTVERGLLGGGLGALVGGVAPLAGAGIRNLIEWGRGKDTRLIRRVLGVSDDAAKAIKAAFDADDPVAAANAMRRSGADAMLADAGPGASQLLDTAMQTSGAAGRVGREAVEGRASAASTRITAAFDRVLGIPGGIKAAAKDISTRTASARKAAYDAAYNTAIDYADNAGRAIEDVLGRIPSGVMRSAINEANDAMKAAGIKNKQIMAQILDDGSVRFVETPNVQQLDEIKKALGSIAAEAVDTFGRKTAAGVRASKLAGDLRDAIAAAVPRYNLAVKLGGDKIAEDTALDLGRNILRPMTTREDVATWMAGKPSREALAAVKRGMREAIDDALANVGRTVTDPNIDAREAIKAVKDLSSRASREKAKAVLGPSADYLFDALDEAAAHLELRSAVSRNSATYGRTAAKEAVDRATQPGALGNLMAGKPGEALRSVVKALTGSTDEVANANKQKLYAEIAQALTEKRGPDAEAALVAIQNAIAGQPVKSADAVRIARALVIGTALPGYQAGTQALTMRQGAQ
ncbi:MAG: hypothetical protein ACRCSU_01075 [Paracoccaceae bacterium]